MSSTDAFEKSKLFPLLDSANIVVCVFLAPSFAILFANNGCSRTKEYTPITPSDGDFSHTVCGDKRSIVWNMKHVKKMEVQQRLRKLNDGVIILPLLPTFLFDSLY